MKIVELDQPRSTKATELMSPFSSQVRPVRDRLSDHLEQGLAQEPKTIAVGKE